jgi:hypothetical protein
MPNNNKVKGLAVLSGTTPVHKFTEDGKANLNDKILIGAGESEDQVILKGEVVLEAFDPSQTLSKAIEEMVKAGDEAVEKLLSEEVDRAKGEEAAIHAELTNNINSEVERAEGEEAAIRSELAGEVDRAKGEEAAIRNELTQTEEALLKQLSETEEALNKALDDETDRAKGEEAAIRSELAGEVDRAEGEEAAIRSELAGEVDRAKGEEADIRSELASEVKQINESVSTNADEIAATQNTLNNVISNTTQGSLDSLTEIVSAFQTADGDLLAAVGEVQTQLSQEVADETARAKGEEAANASEIFSLQVAHGSSKAQQDGRLNQLEDRQDADDAATAAADAVTVTYRGATDSAIATNVSDIASNASDINALGDAHGASKAEQDGRLNQLEDRQDADDAATAAADAVTVTYRAITDADIAANAAANAETQNTLDNVISNTTQGSLDSLTEIVAAFQTADGDLLAAVGEVQTQLSQQVADETARAEGEEAAIKADLASEVKQLKEEDESLKSDIGDVNDAVNSEVSRAEGEEAAIRSELAAEVKDLATYVDTNVKSETDRAEGEEAAIRSQLAETEEALLKQLFETEEALGKALDDETDRAEGEEAAIRSELAAAISAENTAWKAGDEALSKALDDETDRAKGEEADIRSELAGEVDRAKGEEAAIHAELTSNIDSEVERAKGEETILSNSIGTVANRVNAITEDTLDGNNMSLSGFAQLTTVEAAELAVTKSFRVPQVTTQGELDDLVNNYPAANGMMFYLDMDDDAGRTGFEDGYKLYFCEGNEWHPSPFHSEGGEAGNPDPSGSSWEDVLKKAAEDLVSFDPLA